MTVKTFFKTFLILTSVFLSGNAFPQLYNNNLIETTDKPPVTGYKLQIDKQKSVHIPQQKHLFIGDCEAIHSNRDQESVIVYTDHTIIENEGPSTLNGTIEVSYAHSYNK